MSKNKIPFRLRKITTGQFATIDIGDIQEDSVNLNVGFGFGVNEEHCIVGCNARFEFNSKDERFIVLNVICDFEIEIETWKSFINTESNMISFPLSIITHLAIITVGTARGILYEKTVSTKFNTYFLPTINIHEILKENIVIQLKK